MTVPIACTLTSAEQGCHADVLLPGLAALATARESVPEGWRLIFAPDAGVLARIADVVDRERQCCAFLRFELVVPPAGASFVLTIDGPAGSGAFLDSLPSSPPSPAR
jgi:hypothetical protein